MIFDLMSLLFIFSNIYYILNYKRLDEPFRLRDYSKKIDLLYYLLKVIFIFWVIFGIFYNLSTLYYLLMLVMLLRFPVFYTSKAFYLKYHRLVPIFNVILLTILLVSTLID